MSRRFFLRRRSRSLSLLVFRDTSYSTIDERETWLQRSVFFRPEREIYIAGCLFFEKKIQRSRTLVKLKIKEKKRSVSARVVD